jgi:uncharacterized protein (DUF1501 family)
MARKRRMTEEEREMSRRQFMRTAACAAVGTTALYSTVWDLRMMNAAIAQSTDSFSDYKALVCVFLYGGNDANNMVVPTDNTTYNQYATGRGGPVGTPGSLALPQIALGAPSALNGQTSDPVNGIRTWALHPAMSGLATLFNAGHAAVMGNVGTLVAPVTKAQWNANPRVVPIPPQLFSHNDQQVQWQTSVPDFPDGRGWGGRCADLLMGAAYGANPGTSVSMNITVGGTNTFEVGRDVNAYTVNSAGGVTTYQGASARLTVLRQLFNDGGTHANLFDQTYAKTMKTADDNAVVMTQVFNAVTNPPLSTTFPGTSLGNQMKTIARIIKGRTVTGMGHNRQIFFASVGGYDLHNGQVNPADPTLGAHANLLGELSNALAAFYTSLDEAGMPGASKVTAFTVSDFGRTFPTNSDGSDHGWGNHQIVVGGSVNGGQIYGAMPQLLTGGADDTSTGRWIPTTAVDEYAATIARWFGVSNSDLNTIFPNLTRFSHPDLGFMNLT